MVGELESFNEKNPILGFFAIYMAMVGLRWRNALCVCLLHEIRLRMRLICMGMRVNACWSSLMYYYINLMLNMVKVYDKVYLDQRD